MKKMLAIVILLIVFFPTTVQAIEYGGLGGKPAHSDPNDPRTVDWFIYKAEPNTVKTDALIIVNTSAETKTIELYPADRTPSSDGGFALKQKVEPMIEVGSWIHIDEPGPLTLAPNEAKTIPFTVTFPSNPEPGEYTGGIIIQEVKPPLATAGGIALSIRAGIRVYITFPGDIIRQTEIKPLQISQDLSDTTINIALLNSGNVSQSGKLTISIVSLFSGQEVMSFSDINVQVLRDSTLQWHANWPKSWWGGVYTFTATLNKDLPNNIHEIISVPPVTYFVFPHWITLLALALIILCLIMMKVVLRKKQLKKKPIVKKRVARKKTTKKTKKKK